MGNAAGEIPKIADADLVNKVTALGVDRGDTGRPIQHIGPFRLLMPMKLTDAPGVKPHVHTRDRLRNSQLPRGDLSRPAAARLPHMRVREGESEIGQGSGIGRRRVEEVWILSLARHVAWDGIGAADAGRPARLGNLIGGLSRRGGQCGPRDHSGREKIASREFTHRSLPLAVRLPPAQSKAESCAGVARKRSNRGHNGVMKSGLPTRPQSRRERAATATTKTFEAPSFTIAAVYRDSGPRHCATRAAQFNACQTLAKCLLRTASVRAQASAALGAS